MDKNTYRKGLISTITCSILWGFLPIYWNSLKPIPSSVIIFYRIFLMSLTCFLICLYKERSLRGVFEDFFVDRKKMIILTLAGLLLTANWSIYIFTVNAGFIIQTSLGYFIEPLIICLFGMVIYKEKTNKYKKIAIVFSFIGLVFMIVGKRELPLISIALALFFAGYAAIKKSIVLNPFQSLLYETVFIAPIALLVVFYLEGTGQGGLIYGGGKFGLLLFSGLATAVPMGLFSYGANKIPLITLGLTQYISPSIALILGIFLFKEGFDKTQFISFVIIWIGLIIFTYGEVVDNRER